MSLWIENPPYVGYYFGDKYFAFREEGTQIVADVGPLLSDERSIATVADNIFEKYPIFQTHYGSLKLGVQWLLQEGYIPVLKGKTIKFYPKRTNNTQITSSSSTPATSITFSSSSSSSSSTSSSTSASSIPLSFPQRSLSAANPTLTKLDKSKKELAIGSINRAIDHYRSEIAATSGSLSQELICPINLELFKDPVVDEHGHTFERKAIEEWLINHTDCPLRQRITQPLKPNFALKAIVDKIWNESPIPLLPIMREQVIDDDPRKASRLMKLASRCAKENDYATAIQMLTSAFTYSSNTEDFELLPSYYIALGETFKAALAYLYLAKRKIEEGKLGDAYNFLNEAVKLDPTKEHPQVARATTAMAIGLAFSSDQFKSLAANKEIVGERSRRGVLQYWEYALACDAEKPDLYEEIIALDKSPLTNLYLKGILELYTTNPAASANLYRKAVALDPSNPLPHLARLSRLEDTHPERYELSRHLGLERQSYFVQASIQRAFRELQRVREESDAKIRALVERIERLERISVCSSTGKERQPLISLADEGFSIARIGVSSSSSGASQARRLSLVGMEEQMPLPPGAFGAEEWSKYFGNVGKEPPLPDNFNDIISHPCPFWPGKRFGETHLLVLIPEKLDETPYEDGKPFTLNLLGELIKSPKKGSGGFPSRYMRCSSCITNNYGYVTEKRSYWVMISKEVIDGTRNMEYAKQLRLLESKARAFTLMKTKGAPTIIEAATSNLIEYVRSGKGLYNDDPPTWTFCQEVNSPGVNVRVGGMSSEGLCLDDFYNPPSIYFQQGEICGLACAWKFF